MIIPKPSEKPQSPPHSSLKSSRRRPRSPAPHSTVPRSPPPAPSARAVLWSNALPLCPLQSLAAAPAFSQLHPSTSSVEKLTSVIRLSAERCTQ
ncbi:hypothetical protein CORC01_07942 [Colletotrichum orchidophilum]|uniref:Uncharacterized protein n=1 Tax=Colletotrichum orchidophilum TaxID=1209926 RepID=A0A1G4B644_9PEZI|nr:uncharacterized protein CORC01_07942 [Colletotrichum orchidophilum]OHE96796.1 hypothetical protein CORC01_07942 [Colletotrichum orchidophilum]